MIDRERLIAGLRACAAPFNNCKCPYDEDDDCVEHITEEALEYIRKLEVLVGRLSEYIKSVGESGVTQIPAAQLFAAYQQAVDESLGDELAAHMEEEEHETDSNA